MRRRLLLFCLFALPFAQARAADTKPGAQQPRYATRAEILQRIADDETRIRQAQQAQIPPADLATIYLDLSAAYEDVAFYLKSEDALKSAVALLQPGPSKELAVALRRLGILHVIMGDPHRAEKDQLEALAMRKVLGDPRDVAIAFTDLANIYLDLKKYDKALDFSEKSVSAIADDQTVNVDDRMTALHNLTFACLYKHQYDRALATIQKSLQLARTTFGDDSLKAGIDTVFLGVVLWRSGNLDAAAEPMERGIARIRVDMGWGHTIYLHAMQQYAEYLKLRGQLDRAAAAENEVQQARARVDARSLTGRTPTGISSAGLR